MITTKQLKEHVTTRDECTSDQYVCGQVCGEYKHLNIEDKTVLDLGGNIGAFSVYAALRGAKEVVGFEPEESNYELYTLNTAPFLPTVVGVQAAVTMQDRPYVPFYLTTGMAKDGFSTVEFRGRKEIEVVNGFFPMVLDLYRPSVIKMDIEGGEFDLLRHPMPLYVREIVVEIHFSKKRFREQYDELVEPFAAWETIRQPKQTGTNFHTLAHWRR